MPVPYSIQKMSNERETVNARDVSAHNLIIFEHMHKDAFFPLNVFIDLFHNHETPCVMSAVIAFVLMSCWCCCRRRHPSRFIAIVLFL